MNFGTIIAVFILGVLAGMGLFFLLIFVYAFKKELNKHGINPFIDEEEDDND